MNDLRDGISRVMSIREIPVLVATVAAFASGASAATVEAFSPFAAPPISQRFISSGASVVSDGQQTSCRVFSGIDVRASRYTSLDGETLAFSEVTRSPAAGLWINGSNMLTPESSGASWRVVLKYPVDEISVRLGSTEISAKAFLDPAGDSMTFGPRMIEAIEASWRSAEEVRLIGRSQDTGREVVDILVPPSQEDLTACALLQSTFSKRDEPFNSVLLQLTPLGEDKGEASERAPAGADASDAKEVRHTPLFDAASTGVVERGPIRVSWSDRIPGAIDENRLAGCDMTDLGAAEIERYRVTEVTGFVSQSSEAWMTRDALGGIQQVYIPGVFEAIRDSQNDIWVADVSVSAFANDPFERPVHKGCLGSQRLDVIEPLSEIFALVLPEDEVLQLPAIGTAPAAGLQPFISAGGLGAGAAPNSAILFPSSSPFSPGRASSPPSGPPQKDVGELAPIPLPAAGWMLLVCIGALLVRRRRTCA